MATRGINVVDAISAKGSTQSAASSVAILNSTARSVRDAFSARVDEEDPSNGSARRLESSAVFADVGWARSLRWIGFRDSGENPSKGGSLIIPVTHVF